MKQFVLLLLLTLTVAVSAFAQDEPVTLPDPTESLGYELGTRYTAHAADHRG